MAEIIDLDKVRAGAPAEEEPGESIPGEPVTPGTDSPCGIDYVCQGPDQPCTIDWACGYGNDAWCVIDHACGTVVNPA